MKQEKIPVHRLPDNGYIGIEIKKFIDIDSTKILRNEPHRDDHYLFFFQESGESRIMVDFNEIDLKTSDIFCVLPGQVHYGISAFHSYGWVISIEAEFIHEIYQPLLDDLILQNKAVNLDIEKHNMLHQNIELLDQMIRSNNNLQFSKQIIRGLIDACIGIYVSAYHQTEECKIVLSSRPVAIIRSFKKLLLESYTTIKSPSAYADFLHISASYLNESSKQVTGFPAGHWIHTQVITEAKRKLYYTDDSVKEIAYSLGYEDQTYFSRLFSKITGMSALQFRMHSRG